MCFQGYSFPSFSCSLILFKILSYYYLRHPGVADDIDNTLISSSLYLVLAHLLTFLPAGFEAASIPWAILNIRKHPTRPKEYEPRSHKLTLYLGLPPRKLLDRE